jgi:diguanylate cyclase (GGDEF)-like protein/PAS domain S-box-containing protein
MEKSTLKAEQSAGETRSREDRSASGDARNGTPPEGLVAPAPPGSVAAPENSGIEALRNSEERQRFSLEAAGIGVWDMDLVTHRTWNSALHDRIFGYKTPQTDWTFERFISHVHPQDRVRIAALYEKAIRSGGGLDFECRIQRADGTLRWIAGHGRLMHDPQGNPVRMHGTVSDISDQVRMKESLQQQTGLFQMVLNSMSEGVIACNEKGDLILINKSARQSLALDDDITTLAHLSASYEWLMPDGVNPCPTEQQPLYRALAGERLTDFESIVRNTRRNVNLAINSSSAPLTNGGGNIVGALNIFRDVTESRRARHELRSAEQHFRLLVEGTTDYAIFMLDASGFVVSWNPGAQRILGYEEHEAVGRHMSLFYTAEDIRRGEPQRKLAQTIEEGRAEEDAWRVRKDGQRFWSTGVLDALHDESGEVRGFVEIMRDNTERRLAEENTFFLANHDALTGLPNRARFLERLDEALMNADRDTTQVAVLLLDLDRFKLINDTLGHHVGDQLLKKVAHRLTRCVRETDTVARLGGDEFVIILTRLKDVASVEALASKIVQEMARPFHVNRQEVRSGTSLGVAIYRRDGNDPGELLQKADLAMYRAKASGRNHYRIFAPSMLTEVQTRREQEDSMRHALEHHEFELAFQPQIDLATLRLSGAEVLLRSTNRVLQTIPTSKVISLAEDTGLIIPLGEWVLGETCSQLKHWQAIGLPEFKVAVNFSSTHLLAPDFVSTVRRALLDSGLEPRFLELEVTEGLLVAASEANNQVMTSLKELGVSISVDDFGTGFSALSYLKNFPVDVLKLDESLVRHLPADLDDVAIVSAIIRLALDLNIKVIAEGVETADQLAYLRSTNCNTAQGFLFSPAVRPDKFEVLLMKEKWSTTVLH